MLFYSQDSWLKFLDTIFLLICSTYMMSYLKVVLLQQFIIVAQFSLLSIIFYLVSLYRGNVIYHVGASPYSCKFSKNGFHIFPKALHKTQSPTLIFLDLIDLL